MENKEIDENKKPKNENTRLSERTIQIIAMLSLVALLIMDKILNLMTPPLPDYWYGIPVGISLMGSQATTILNKLIK